MRHRQLFFLFTNSCILKLYKKTAKKKGIRKNENKKRAKNKSIRAGDY